MEKEILDVCCGGKHFWFDKNDPDTLYLDRRTEPKGSIPGQRNWTVSPDIIGDYRKLNDLFEEESFSLIIFDPPHKIKSDRGIITKKYGSLGSEWESDLKEAFNQIWKILKVNGTLIFKWCDLDISVRSVTDLFEIKPKMGTVTKKGVNNTYFLVYFKSNSQDSKC